MKIVLALGGNALGNDPKEQKELVKKTASAICDLIRLGHELIITHGNGPQVGMINLAFSEANKISNTPLMPFPECGAMSQGYIGYHLQNALYNELTSRKIKKEVATVITQVEVLENDPAFLNPTKPIGGFYTQEESEKIAKITGYIMMKDANRGYRRVVASPNPIDIVEIDIIKELINQGKIVITCGGGGIPVIKKNGELVGVDAVIDKDFASALLADKIDADIFIILTAVDKVSLNFGKENQTDLDVIKVSEIDKLITEGHFAKGSMLPKIEAAKNFVQKGNNRNAIITSLQHAKDALNNFGTKITN